MTQSISSWLIPACFACIVLEGRAQIDRDFFVFEYLVVAPDQRNEFEDLESQMVPIYKQAIDDDLLKGRLLLELYHPIEQATRHGYSN